MSMIASTLETNIVIIIMSFKNVILQCLSHCNLNSVPFWLIIVGMSTSSRLYLLRIICLLIVSPSSRGCYCSSVL